MFINATVTVLRMDAQLDKHNATHCAKNQVSIPRKPIGNQQETPGLHVVSP